MKTKTTSHNTNPGTQQQQLRRQTRRTALFLGLCAGLCTLTLGTNVALAQDMRDPAASIPSNTSKQSTNKNFLEKAYESSCEETHISRVVAKRSNNPEVRDFAKSLDSTHSTMDKDLAKLAGTKGVALPNHDKDNTNLMEKWTDKNIKDLDEDYVDAMVDSHEDTVELFQKAATNTDLDPALSEYARNALPELQKHLARAKQLDKALN